jgi:hypothetical protein
MGIIIAGLFIWLLLDIYLISRRVGGISNLLVKICYVLDEMEYDVQMLRNTLSNYSTNYPDSIDTEEPEPERDTLD